MNPYIFALAVLLIGALVAVALLAYKLARAGAEVVGGTVRTTSKHVAATVRDVAAETIAPISKGVGHIADAVAGRIEMRQKELHHLRSQVDTLTAKIKHLENQHVSVDRIEPVLKLALVSVEYKMTDAVQESLRTTPAGITSQKEIIEYLGIFDAANTQRLGVDLNRLRFRKLSDTVVEVTGLAEMEVVGNINTVIKPRHCELRQRLTEGTVRPDAHIILQGDPDGLRGQRSLQQQADLLAKITQPQPIKVINAAIEKLALQFLQTYFALAGITVVKATGDLQDGKTLDQICADINGSVDQLVAAKGEEVKLLEARLARAEDELRDEVKQMVASQFRDSV